MCWLKSVLFSLPHLFASFEPDFAADLVSLGRCSWSAAACKCLTSLIIPPFSWSSSDEAFVVYTLTPPCEVWLIADYRSIIGHYWQTIAVCTHGWLILSHFCVFMFILSSFFGHVLATSSLDLQWPHHHHVTVSLAGGPRKRHLSEVPSLPAHQRRQEARGRHVGCAGRWRHLCQ